MLTWKTNAFGESYSPEINKDTFEKVPSKVVYERYVKNKLEENHALYIIVGTDSGLFPAYVEIEFEKSGSSFLFIDTLEVMEKLNLNTFEEDAEFGKLKKAPLVKIIRSDTELSTFFAVDGRYEEFFLRKQVYLVKSLSVVEKNDFIYQDIYKNYESQLISLQLINNVSSARRFMNAMFQTACDMIYPVKLIKDCYQGKTFVLLGGAPSLPTIFPWLKEHRDNLVVIAASRIAGRLKQEEITPDFFVAVDPDPEMLDYSRELFEFADRSILVTSNHLSPNVMEQWSGRNLYTGYRFPFIEKGEDETGNLLGAGPTVMNLSVMLAGYLGAKTIVLSGVDFCYDPSGNSHESSSLESQIGRYFRYGGHRIATYSGLEAETDAQMLAASKGLGEQVAWLKETIPTLSVFNVNPYASVVKGVEQITIQNLELPPTIRSEEKSQIWSATKVNSLDYKTILERKVLAVVEKQSKRLRKVIELAKKGTQLTRFLCNSQDVRFSGWIRDIQKTRKKIEDIMGNDLYMLFDYAYLDYVQLVQPMEDEEQTIEQIQNVLKSYFTAVEKSLLAFSDELRSIQQKARWRLRECKCCLTNDLLDYWLTQERPGRVHAFINRCGLPMLTPEQNRMLTRANNEFKNLLASKVPSFKSHYENSHQQLTSLWSHSKAAIQAKDLDRLQDMVDYILTIDRYEFQQLGLYLKANLAKESQDWNQFNDLTSKIEHQRLIIPALQLKLDVALIQKDVIAILDAIEDLASVDAYYLHIFAKVAPMLGQPHLAIPAFIRYLSIRPTDRLALWDYWIWLKMNNEQEHASDLKDFIVHFELDEPELLMEVDDFLLSYQH